MKLKRPAALLALLLCASCAGVAETYVKADRATFDAITPDYINYVDADRGITAEQRARKLRTVHTWKVRLEAVEKK